jgi:hypothetical protein
MPPASDGRPSRDADLEWLLACLAAKNVGAQCPICDNAGWKPMNEAAVVGIARNASDGVRAVGLVCTNCGFLRLHAAAVLTQPGPT